MRVDGIEQAGVLDQQQRALVAERQRGADRDAFVLLAHAHQAEALVLGERPQHALARGDVGHRDDELDAARRYRVDDLLAFYGPRLAHAGQRYRSLGAGTTWLSFMAATARLSSRPLHGSPRMPDGTDLFEIIHSTRAMRRLKPDPVPDALMRRSSRPGTAPPNGGNTQRWRFLVVKDPAIKKAVQVWYKKAFDEVVGPHYAGRAAARRRPRALPAPARRRGISDRALP